MTKILQVNGRQIDYAAGGLLPEHMRGAMKRYIEDRIAPGSFLTAVLTNDLFEAMGRADDINRHRIFDICMWLYNHAPAGCFGSPERYVAWFNGPENDAA